MKATLQKVLNHLPYIGRLRRQIAVDAETIRLQGGEIIRLVRNIKYGGGSTFQEIRDKIGAPDGSPYTFDQLAELAKTSSEHSPTVPPLAFIHIPKSGGTFINNILMKNYRMRLDSFGDAFFPRYFPDEFLSLCQPPINDDSRRPIFFTGHYDLRNEIFIEFRVPYLAITVLRHPVQRVLSHYRYHATLVESDLGQAILNENLSPLAYIEQFRDRIPLQYEIFLIDQDFADCKTDEALAERAFENLSTRISLFGLLEDIDAFVVMARDLIGLSDVFYAKPINKTAPHAPNNQLEATEKERLEQILKADILFYEKAKELFHERAEDWSGGKMESLKTTFRKQNTEFASLKQGADQKQDHQHPWRAFYS